MSRSGRSGRRRSAAVITAVLAASLLVAGCAATSAVAPPVADAPGFWLGLWHGMILPITFFVSLFVDDVAVYAVPNAGHLYDFGFVIGACVIPLPGTLLRATTSRRRARAQR